jgi:hypothetical protein
MKTSLFAAILLAPLAVMAALAAPAAADRAEAPSGRPADSRGQDDLQLVRKAVASSTRVAQARPPAEAPPAPVEAKPTPRKDAPQWFHVRIAEKGGKHARVSISLPLGIVRSLGDEWPIAGHGGCRKEHCPTVGEVLRALDSGQSLVEIEGDDTTVRVWVE